MYFMKKHIKITPIFLKCIFNYRITLNKIQPKNAEEGFLYRKKQGAEEVMLELNTKNSSI